MPRRALRGLATALPISRPGHAQGAPWPPRAVQMLVGFLAGGPRLFLGNGGTPAINSALHPNLAIGLPHDFAPVAQVPPAVAVPASPREQNACAFIALVTTQPGGST